MSRFFALPQPAARRAPRAAESAQGLPLQRVAPPAACPCGGGCPACNRGDPFERQARQLAGSAAPLLPARAARAQEAAGEPLDPAQRQALEARLGADLGGVRVHHDGAAAASARALGARAYAQGEHLVFGRGEYRPDTAAGRRLLVHELAHTLQQRAGGAPRLQRAGFCDDAGAEGGAEAGAQPAPAPAAPGPLAGVSLFPGEWGLRPLLGRRLPLPASLRATNALGAGVGPSWVLDIAPQQLVLSLLGRVELSASPHPGASEAHRGDAAQQQRIALRGTLLTFDPARGRLRGRATLEVPTQYPTTIRPPDELQVQIESDTLGAFSGTVGYGPLTADLALRLHYDTARLEAALRPAFAPEGGGAGFAARLRAIVRRHAPGVAGGPLDELLRSLWREARGGRIAAGALVERVAALVADSVPAGAGRNELCAALRALEAELTHPGFSLRGGLGLDIPGVGRLPLSRFSAESPTTRPLARPLLGAPTAFPLTYRAGGVILAPPGAITDIAVPALGYTYSSFGARSGTAFTTAALPTLSPTAIGAPGSSFNEKFPLFVFAELSHVRRVSSELDLGLRLTAQFSTPDLTGRSAGASGDPGAQLQEAAAQFQQAGDPKAGGTPPVPNIGVSLFGRFGGPL